MHTLTVDLGDRSYPIYIGSGILGDHELLSRHVTGGQVMVVTNDVVAPIYLDKLRRAAVAQSWNEVVLPDGEANKNLDTLNLVFDELLASRHSRGTTIVALGGGVIGDMAGFSAACYQRGVNFIQVPTTLLAQVDSSVGGKTGVNHPLGKNMIGAFYQPQCVIIDTDTLKTLPARELRAGLAEVIKYGIISDSQFFSWLEQNYQALLDLEQDALSYAIQRSCENKAQVVAQDERESGIRAILNFGHTFGHAIETEQGYGEWLHGEAVAAGMVMAADLSIRMGLLEASEGARIRSIIEAVGLPSIPPGSMSDDDFLARMSVDKKVIDGQLRLVLVNAIGAACVTADVDSVALGETFAAGQGLCR